MGTDGWLTIARSISLPRSLTFQNLLHFAAFIAETNEETGRPEA